MKSYPSASDVVEGLGDKFTRAAIEARGKTRADLALYRQVLPDFVSQHSPRGLANWIHDRLWHHLVTELGEQDRVKIIDKDVTRELVIHDRYRVRVKRHGQAGAVRTFPTQGALEFMGQPEQLTFDGLSMHHLIVGYEWDVRQFEIGPAVLSLRDGKHIVWYVPLGDKNIEHEPAMFPRVSSPQRPVIEVVGSDDVISGEETSGGYR